jgi:NAD(P)-dependent dehydrogenase (short-subunit alcohol dehydrogenase family)
MTEQQTAVVTGASTGFGHLTALALATAGLRVYGGMREVATRNASAAQALRSRGVVPIELDVTSDASVDAASQAILAESGRVDVLVNNAGVGYFGIQESFTPAAAERQFTTNVFGPLRVNRAFLPGMRERRSGLIVYVSSVVGRFVIPFGGIYTASKWALEALAEVSAYELAPFGVDVAIVEPGAYPTAISANRTEADDLERAAAYGDAARFGERVMSALAGAAEGRDPADVAAAIVRLAQAPSGTRPLRTSVPADPATDAINAATAPIQRAVLEGFGVGELARTATQPA